MQGILMIAGGTFSNSTSTTDSYVVANTKTLNITGGTYTLTNSGQGSAIYCAASSTNCQVKNATVNSNRYGIANGMPTSIGWGIIRDTNITTTSNYPGIQNLASSKTVVYGGTETGTVAINNANSNYAVETFGNTTSGIRNGPVYVLWDYSSTQKGIKTFGRGTINRCPTWTTSDQSDIKWYTGSCSTDANSQSYCVCYVTKSNHPGTVFLTHFYNGTSTFMGNLEHTWNWSLTPTS